MSTNTKARRVKQKPSKKKVVSINQRGTVWWRYIVGLIAITFSLFPVLFVLSTAFNSLGILDGTHLIPQHYGLDNFRHLFVDFKDPNSDPTLPASHPPFWSWYRNSLLLSVTAAFLQCVIAAYAAFAFSRLRFKGRKATISGLLIIQMFPQALGLVALIEVAQRLGAIWPGVDQNTYTGLLLIYLGGAMGFNAYLIKGYFDTIPTELDEAATIDGATSAQIFFKILLPLSAPILAVVALLSFIGLINDFLLVQTFLTLTGSDDTRNTLATGLHTLVGDPRSSNWGVFAAGALLASIPMVILFQFLQRYIVGGLTSGSVKG
ncbi:MAG: sugar ABC transporter permease [Actinobacteria bacterium]|nr:sugar ABC transporter permease [Actinomycetota bacterium]